MKVYVEREPCRKDSAGGHNTDEPRGTTARRGPRRTNTWPPKDGGRAPSAGRSRGRQAVVTVEARLQGIADAWHRLRPLPATLTNRPEKMVWNGDVPVAKIRTCVSFQTACERLRGELALRA